MGQTHEASLIDAWAVVVRPTPCTMDSMRSQRKIYSKKEGGGGSWVPTAFCVRVCLKLISVF